MRDRINRIMVGVLDGLSLSGWAPKFIWVASGSPDKFWWLGKNIDKTTGKKELQGMDRFNGRHDITEIIPWHENFEHCFHV